MILGHSSLHIWKGKTLRQIDSMPELSPERVSYLLKGCSRSRLKYISQLTKSTLFIPAGTVDEKVNVVPHLVYILD